MKDEKFKSEVETLNKFFSLYCKDKHQNRISFTQKVEYKGQKYLYELCLCEDCKKLIGYSYERVKSCPHHNKPRCRTCANPCYDKKEWKSLAKVMRYSGTKLKLIKVKNIIFGRTV